MPMLNLEVMTLSGHLSNIDEIHKQVVPNYVGVHFREIISFYSKVKMNIITFCGVFHFCMVINRYVGISKYQMWCNLLSHIFSSLRTLTLTQSQNRHVQPSNDSLAEACLVSMMTSKSVQTKKLDHFESIHANSCICN